MAQLIGNIHTKVFGSTLAFLVLGFCGLDSALAVDGGQANTTLSSASPAPTLTASDINSMCIGCHGISGYKSSFPSVYNVPYISGQNAKYLESALKAYQKSDRSHPTMRSIAGSLSEKDISILAEFYSQPNSMAKISGQPRLSAAAEAGKTLANAQCAICHAKDGNWNTPMDATYPKLAGQHRDYLTHSLREYQTGTRNNAVMAGIAKDLSKQDIRNLSAYFSALNGDLYLKK